MNQNQGVHLRQRAHAASLRPSRRLNMMESDKTKAIHLNEHHPEDDVEVSLRTNRKISENEKRTISDLVHEMALTVNRLICDGNNINETA